MQLWRWWVTVRQALVRVVMWAGGEGSPEEWLARAYRCSTRWTEQDETPGAATERLLDLRLLDQRPPAYALRLERRAATVEERAQVVQDLQEWVRLREQIARHQPTA